MPKTKNALYRFMILDQLLSNRATYTKDDMLQELNSRLAELGFEGVSMRTLEHDLNDIETMFADRVELKRTYIAIPNKNAGRSNADLRKVCVRYATRGSSIFVQPLTDEERELLAQSVSLLGSFEGIPNMEALEQLSGRMEGAAATGVPAVVMESNCLSNTNFFGLLFMAIKQRSVVRVKVRTFYRPDQIDAHKVHPCQLREYNNRWYLLGRKEEPDGTLHDEVWPFRLDSMVDVEVLGEPRVGVPEETLRDFFDDIIGVTNYHDRPCLEIRFWVDDSEVGYVETKPLHGSQRRLRDEEDRLRAEWPDLPKGRFYAIECKENYELIRTLVSYGDQLVVLSPEPLRRQVGEWAQKLYARYGGPEAK